MIEIIKEPLIIGLMIYWLPIYIYLIIYSVKIRIYVKKNNISSLDTTDPITYKVGKLTDFQLLGEILVYTMAFFAGVFTFIVLPKDMIKNKILPDA